MQGPDSTRRPGCPQGGVVSPVTSNIYLDRMDTYIEQAPRLSMEDRKAY